MSAVPSVSCGTAIVSPHGTCKTHNVSDSPLHHARLLHSRYRAFSGRTPVEEYALETRSAYARLLTDFRREALAALFRGATAPPGVFGH